MHGKWQQERGQMLLLFVAVFSIVLVLAAFVIDQGFWMGRKRAAQTAADAAARSGAIAEMGRPTGSCVPTSPACALPCREAALTAILNDVQVSNQCDNGSTETVFESRVISGTRCLEATVDENEQPMFSAFFGIALGDVHVGATSTACAGTVDAVEAFAGDQDPDGIAVVLGRGGNRDCFSGSSLDVGRECVIWGAIDDNSQHNRLLWTQRRECPAGNISGSVSQISIGVAWQCRRGDEIRANRISSVADSGVDQDDVLFAFRSRLQSSTACDRGPDSASFRAAFGRADGLPFEAQPPPPFTPSGGNRPRNAIYAQNDCFNNPRIVVLPLTLGSITSSGNKDIDGFAVVYLTGCYDRRNSIQEPNAAAESNTCSASALPGPTSQDDSRECVERGSYEPSAFCRVEIRGVPLRLFLTRGAVGNLRAMTDANFPLTIQTVE
jgi:hypothetical protein